MQYTIEDIRKALIPVIGEGEATQKILESFATKNKAIEVNYIVRRGQDLYRVIHISDTYKCKSWDGIVIELNFDEVTLASDFDRMQYYRKQVEFLRTNIAPFLNYFHMRQLYHQLKDVDSKKEMSDELDKIEQNCFSKLQDIKKLW